AIADQGRALAGKAALDGPTQTLPMLYQLPFADFHDITTGSNGYPAKPGYDDATGIGSFKGYTFAKLQ
ncbi:MAG: peptidase S8, partial [Candidatus Eremiobacteraeota bacterium]|nr:peptidase S8 [Candidatus Eremiobacteraeota bacterium]